MLAVPMRSRTMHCKVSLAAADALQIRGSKKRSPRLISRLLPDYAWITDYSDGPREDLPITRVRQTELGGSTSLTSPAAFRRAQSQPPRLRIHSSNAKILLMHPRLLSSAAGGMRSGCGNVLTRR